MAQTRFQLLRQTFTGKFSNSHQNLLRGKCCIQKLTVFHFFLEKSGKINIILELYECHISCFISNNALNSCWRHTPTKCARQKFLIAAKEFLELKKEAKAVDEESERKHKICVVDPIDLANSMEKATEFEFYYDEMTCDIQRMCVCTDASSCIIRCTLSNPMPCQDSTI